MSTPSTLLNLERHPAWSSKMSKQLQEYQELTAKGELQFDWQNVNCAWFAADIVQVMTGYDLYDQYFGAADTPQKAAKVLLELGHRSMTEFIQARLPEIPPIMAQRGDVVLVEGLSDEGPACAIADPPFFWAVGLDGLVKGTLYPDPGNPNVGVILAFKVG